MGPIFLVNFFLILLNPHALLGRPLTPNVLQNMFSLALKHLCGICLCRRNMVGFYFSSSLLSGPEVRLELEAEKSKIVPGFLLARHSEKMALSI